METLEYTLEPEGKWYGVVQFLYYGFLKTLSRPSTYYYSATREYFYLEFSGVYLCALHYSIILILYTTVALTYIYDGLLRSSSPIIRNLCITPSS